MGAQNSIYSKRASSAQPNQRCTNCASEPNFDPRSASKIGFDADNDMSCSFIRFDLPRNRHGVTDIVESVDRVPIGAYFKRTIDELCWRFCSHLLR
jgi:hypothetical protein